MSRNHLSRDLLRLYDVRLELNSIAYLLERRADDFLDAKEMDDMNCGLGRILGRLCKRLQKIEDSIQTGTDPS